MQCPGCHSPIVKLTTGRKEEFEIDEKNSVDGKICIVNNCEPPIEVQHSCGARFEVNRNYDNFLYISDRPESVRVQAPN